MADNGKKRRPGRPRNPIARETLIALALQAFAEGGYAGASMAQIAQSAGLRKASLFHHFPTKEALYLEMLAGIAADLAALVDEARLNQGPFLERLDRLSALATDFLGERPGTAQVLLRELIDGGPFYDGPGSSAINATLDGVAAFLQSGMLQGELPFQDPHHLALTIASVHLSYFSVPKVCGELLEADIFSEATIASRRDAVIQQVRLLCGAPSGV